MAGSIKRPQLCTVKNNKNNERQAKSKEKQVRKIARKKNKEEQREYRNKKGNGEQRKTKWIKREVRKQECDKACTNRLLSSLPLNSLLSSKIKGSEDKPFRSILSKQAIFMTGFPCEIAHIEKWFPS